MQEEGSTSTLEVTEAEGGQKLMQFLQRRLSLPQAMLHRWVRTGQIRRNGGRCKPFDHVQTGDMVRLPPFALAMHRSAAPAASPSTVAPAAPNFADRRAHDAPHAAASPAASPASPSGPHAPAGSASCANPAPAVSPASPAASCVDPDPAAPSSSPSSPCPHSSPGSQDDSLTLLHADGYLLVLNKPAGLPVRPGTGHSDSIATRLAARYPSAPFRPTPAHRLDKDTSGLLLAASAYSTLRALQDAFRHRHMVKEYVAWVHGAWAGDEPVLLRHRLAKKYEGWDEKMRVLTTPDHAQDASAEEGKEAVCVVRCLRREIDPLTRPHGPYYGARSLVQVRLITGRTHQIRAQLAAVGHPLCGDVKYGAPEQRGQAAPAAAPASPAASSFPAPARLASPLSPAGLSPSARPESPRPASGRPASGLPASDSPTSGLPAPGRSAAPESRPAPPAAQQPARTLYLHSLRIILPEAPELAHLPRQFTVLPPWRGRQALRELPPPLTVPEL